MTTFKEKMQAHDRGLTYEEAGHGVQSGVMHEIGNSRQQLSQPDNNHLAGPKHLRTGLDMRAADHAGLVALLVDKGLFTMEEYLEYMRLSANEELARWEMRMKTLFATDITLR